MTDGWSAADGPAPPEPRGASVRFPGPARHAHPLVGPVATMVVAVLVSVATLAQVWTKYLWFRSVGFEGVLERQTAAQVGLFAGTALVGGGLLASSLVLASRTRPIHLTPLLGPRAGRRTGTRAERRGPDDGRRLGPFEVPGAPEPLEPLRRLLVLVAPVVVGVATGAAAASQWRTLLLWWHRRPFDVVDPLSGRDVGFFVFELPWWQLVTDLLLMSVALAAVAAAAAHYAYGGLRIGPGARSTRAAVAHLSLLVGALAVLQGLRYRLDGLAAAVADTSQTPGLPSAVEHGVMPGKTILAAAAVLVALLCLVSARTRSWRLPVIGVVALAVCALVIGSVYPAIVQGAHSGDTTATVAATSRSLAATRAAFGLADARPGPSLPAASDVSAALEGAVVPILDPTSPILPAGSRYTVSAPMSVVPSSCSGASEIAVGPRMPPRPGDRDHLWDEEHLVRTHAWGLLAQRLDAVDSDGAPIEVSAEQCLGLSEPDAYFAPGLDGFVVVGAAGAPGEAGLDGRTTTYRGSGGVALNGPARRLAEAVALHEPQLVTRDLGSGARLLEVRDPAARVARVAPWLRLDSQTRPAVVGGRLVWTVVGYTTSSTYPGAMTVQLGATTRSGAASGDRSIRASYVRASVLATVDARDGGVQLYAVDPADPVLGAWQDAFPGSVRPLGEAPAAIRSSMRYPRDLLVAQQRVLTRYHGTDAAALGRGPSWEGTPAPATQTSPQAPTAWPSPAQDRTGPEPAKVAGTGAVPAEPVEMKTRLTDSAAPTLVTTMTDGGTGRLAAVLAGGVVDDSSGSPRYRLSIVEPARSRTPGPVQVLAAMRGSTATDRPGGTSLGQLLTAPSGKAASARLLTVPTAEGIVSVLPVWTSTPPGSAARLRAVVVEAGSRIGWGKTVDAAVRRLSVDSDPAAGEAPRLAVDRARRAMDALDRATRAGDRAAAAKATTELREALAAAATALGE